MPFDAEMVLTGLLGMKPPRTESKLMNLLHECHIKLIFRGKGLLALLVRSTRAETGLSGSSDTNCHMWEIFTTDPRIRLRYATMSLG